MLVVEGDQEHFQIFLQPSGSIPRCFNLRLTFEIQWIHGTLLRLLNAAQQDQSGMHGHR